MAAAHIQVRTNFVGVHCWLDAPEEVAFLRNLHRHVFNIEATMEVYHNDRELEFFMVRQQIDCVIGTYVPYHPNMPGIKMLGTRSCEDVAVEVQEHLRKKYNRYISVTVREDGENAGIV